MVLIYVQWTSMPRIRAASLQPLRHPPLQQFYWNEHPPCSADRLSGGFCSLHETQLFCALRYIHSDKNRIIHCDVKPENILLKQYHGFDIKLIDFGSSNHLKMDYSKLEAYLKQHLNMDYIDIMDSLTLKNYYLKKKKREK